MNSQILLVDDNPAMIQLMAGILAGVGHIRFATSGAAAIQQVHDLRPDLILLDADMPDMDGFQVCEALKADPSMAEVPVVFVTGHDSAEFELRGLGCGAVDFLHKPVSGPLLLARVATQLRVKHLNDELKRIATIDALTDTANRRAFDDALQREWKRCLRSGQPLSLLMVDVDHFKRFNDSCGHPAGDACLRKIAQALQSASLRPADVVARYGGEEFALLLPDTPRQGAAHLAQRVLDTVAALRLPHPALAGGAHVSVSVGIGAWDACSARWPDRAEGIRFDAEPLATALQLVQAADQALYAAKAAGRAQAWQLDISDVCAPQNACRTAWRQPAAMPMAAA